MIRHSCIVTLLLLLPALQALAEETRDTELYSRLKAKLDAVPAIDTHDHLWPLDRLPGFVETEQGRGMNLAGLWRNSYFTWIHPLTPWQPGMKFDDWWVKARHDFDNARATSFYRYQLPAFQDLYGVDFDHMTDEQARELNDRIFQNYKDSKWVYHVITERANIELMFNDPNWSRLKFEIDHPFEVRVMYVTQLVRGFHPSEYPSALDSPFVYAEKVKLPMNTLDDYLLLLDRLFQDARQADCMCLKSTLAYLRTLDFANVEREQAARAFGRPKSELTAAEVKD
jgi:hypothetical protein